MKKIIGIVLVTMLFSVFLPSKIYAILISKDPVYLYENGQKITNSSVILVDDNTREICFKGSCDLYQSYVKEPVVTFYKTTEVNILNFNDWRARVFLNDKNCSDYIVSGWENWWQKWLQEKTKSGANNNWVQERINTVKPQIKTEVSDDLWIKRIKFMLESGGSNFYLNQNCEKYDNEAYYMYIQNYIDTALYSNKIIIPKAGNSEFMNTKKLVDNINGFSRCYNVDIKTKEIKEIICPIQNDNATEKTKQYYNKMKIQTIAELFVLMLIIVFIASIFTVFSNLKKNSKK